MSASWLDLMWVVLCYVLLAVGVIWSARRVFVAPGQLLQGERVPGAGCCTAQEGDDGNGHEGLEQVHVEQEEWEAWEREWAAMCEEKRGRTLSRS
jgi:hypothetical protein